MITKRHRRKAGPKSELGDGACSGAGEAHARRPFGGGQLPACEPRLGRTETVKLRGDELVGLHLVEPGK